MQTITMLIGENCLTIFQRNVAKQNKNRTNMYCFSRHEVLRADTSWGGIFGNFVTPRSVSWQEKDTVA